MTTNSPRPSTGSELLILGTITGIGIFLGAVLILVGVFNGNGGIFEGPSLTDVATKITLISVGSTVLSTGFLGLIAALVLSGVQRALVHAPAARTAPASTPSGEAQATP
jgi:hypothetical protein